MTSVSGKQRPREIFSGIAQAFLTKIHGAIPEFYLRRPDYQDLWVGFRCRIKVMSKKWLINFAFIFIPAIREKYRNFEFDSFWDFIPVIVTEPLNLENIFFLSVNNVIRYLEI